MNSWSLSACKHIALGLIILLDLQSESYWRLWLPVGGPINNADGACSGWTIVAGQVIRFDFADSLDMDRLCVQHVQSVHGVTNANSLKSVLYSSGPKKSYLFWVIPAQVSKSLLGKKYTSYGYMQSFSAKSTFQPATFTIGVRQEQV